MHVFEITHAPKDKPTDSERSGGEREMTLGSVNKSIYNTKRGRKKSHNTKAGNQLVLDC